ncbi:MAG: hypothetical protein LBC67_05070 [Spirochaetales bacterium]|nr:hypothetical protein [Spirochaetales bacterium]
MVLGNEIPFTITYQASFQIPCPPADTDIEYVCEFIGYANCRIAKEDTTVKKDSAGEDSQKEECSLSFFALATHRPQKAEITLRVTKQKNTQSTNARQNKAEFTLAFDKKVHPAYRKTIQLDFAGYAGKLLPQIQAVKPVSAVMP